MKAFNTLHVSFVAETVDADFAKNYVRKASTISESRRAARIYFDSWFDACEIKIYRIYWLDNVKTIQIAANPSTFDKSNKSSKKTYRELIPFTIMSLGNLEKITACIKDDNVFAQNHIECQDMLEILVRAIYQGDLELEPYQYVDAERVKPFYEIDVETKTSFVTFAERDAWLKEHMARLAHSSSMSDLLQDALES